MTQIIAFTGKRGHGKDSAAAALFPAGFKKMSFADPLREVVELVYGISIDEMIDPILKEQPLTRFPFLSPREILIKLGTEGFRNLIHDNTWVEAFVRRARDFDRIVVTDLRFLNEEKVLKDNGALIIRVFNPNRQDNDLTSQHRSETEMDLIRPHHTIINDGTIEELHGKVNKIIDMEYNPATRR